MTNNIAVRGVIHLLLFLTAASPAAAADYYNIAAGGDGIVNEWSTCKDVENNCAKAIFVPTKTSPEWSAFRTSPPGCVSFSDCAPSQTAYYSRATAATKACNSQTLAQGNTACQSEFGASYSWAYGTGGFRSEATEAIKEVSGSFTTGIYLIQYYADFSDYTAMQQADSEAAISAGGGSFCSGTLHLQCLKSVNSRFSVTTNAYCNNIEAAMATPAMVAAFDSVNGEYGLVWQNYSDNTIYMRRITKYGAKSGARMPLASLSSKSEGVWAAFDSTNQRYFIAWREDSSTANYYGILVSTYGTVLKSAFTIATGLYNTYNTFQMAYETGQGRYILVNGEGLSTGYLHGAYYDSSANIIGSSFTITSAGADTAALAYNSNGTRWVVNYKDWSSVIHSDVFQWNGTAPTNTNTCTNCAAYSIAASTSDGQFLMAYGDGTHVYTRLIGTTGSVGAALQIDHAATVVKNPQAIYLPSLNRYLVGWRNYYQFLNLNNTQYSPYEVGKQFWTMSGDYGFFVPNTGVTGGFAYFGNSTDNTPLQVKIVSADMTDY